MKSSVSGLLSERREYMVLNQLPINAMAHAFLFHSLKCCSRRKYIYYQVNRKRYQSKRKGSGAAV